MIADIKHALVDTAVLIAVIAVAGVAGYGLGVQDATYDAKVAEYGRTEQALKEQRDADNRILAREKALRQADRDTFNQYREKDEEAHEKNDRLVADLRSGARRLRIPTVNPVCPAAPTAGGPASTNSEPQGYADVDPAVADNLIALTSRGDDAIRKHAAVVDLYNHLLEACTAPAQPEAQP